ncbi:hypothetical protein N0V84_007790 [Fusarium piperis]|uniref:Uncharacterized protein n=1 Tax=Fusarium piperis TaxID=1435070 RepID=A0A9W8W9E5_9HYPO|nr:hypothetical protein N0V84_007790 [Fusarium piperis]
MAARQDSDNLAWDRSDELWEKAMKQVRLSSTCRKIESLVEKGLSANVLVRLPCPDQAVFPAEKTLAEAATTAFISQHTQLPAPKVSYHGIDADAGPFMIIEDLGSRRGMGQALEAPREDPNDAPVLRPDISEIKLKGLYAKMALCTTFKTADEWYVALAEM